MWQDPKGCQQFAEWAVCNCASRSPALLSQHREIPSTNGVMGKCACNALGPKGVKPCLAHQQQQTCHIDTKQTRKDKSEADVRRTYSM
eukprot:scaffold280985_cov19-Tisochrysis_lutea.AAC.1